MNRKKIRLGDSKVAVASLRVSKDDQRLGPEAQRTSIEQWAAREGVTVVAWHTDHLSSVTPIEDRPGLMGALSDLRKHNAGILVVAKRDRLARDPILTAEVERTAEAMGVSVVSAAGEGSGTTPADEFMRGVIDSASRYERKLIRLRTLNALAELRERGEKTGGKPPYGYRVVDGPMVMKKGSKTPVHAKMLEPHPLEQEIVDRIKSLRMTGASYGDISKQLSRSGHMSRKGTPFHKVQIARIVGDEASC